MKDVFLRIILFYESNRTDMYWCPKLHHSFTTFTHKVALISRLVIYLKIAISVTEFNFTTDLRLPQILAAV